MKFAMKHGGLCSMSFVLRICSCVVFLCTWVAFLCACEGNASKISNTGVEESTYVLQSGIGTDAATSLEGQPVMRKGYTIDVYYNEKAASFSDDEVEQIRMYINQEYKEVRLSEINIQGW